jgi:hypothetical protein
MSIITEPSTETYTLNLGVYNAVVSPNLDFKLCLTKKDGIVTAVLTKIANISTHLLVSVATNAISFGDAVNNPTPIPPQFRPTAATQIVPVYVGSLYTDLAGVTDQVLFLEIGINGVLQLLQGSLFVHNFRPIKAGVTAGPLFRIGDAYIFVNGFAVYCV